MANHDPYSDRHGSVRPKDLAPPRRRSQCYPERSALPRYAPVGVVKTNGATTIAAKARQWPLRSIESSVFASLSLNFFTRMCDSR
jgi:hypothetical protein